MFLPPTAFYHHQIQEGLSKLRHKKRFMLSQKHVNPLVEVMRDFYFLASISVKSLELWSTANGCLVFC